MHNIGYMRTNGYVLVGLTSIRTLPNIVVLLFSQNALRTLRYAWKKNQTSKVSLCCKRTGSKNHDFRHFLGKIIHPKHLSVSPGHP